MRRACRRRRNWWECNCNREGGEKFFGNSVGSSGEFGGKSVMTTWDAEIT